MIKSWLALGAAFILAIGCSDEPAGNVPVEPVVTRIAFDRDSVALNVGEEVAVTAVAYDYRGQNLGSNPGGVALQWNTQDFRVATVTDGVIRGVKEGRVVVFVRAGSVTNGLRVNVGQP